MTAVRLARGFSGRRKIVKFDGCYHGHGDSLLVSAGSGLLSGGIGSSAGIPPSVVADVFVAPYNDPEAAKKILSAHGEEVAAIILEPVAGNMGLIEPVAGFLETLRRLADDSGALLIFDEVITGFRLGPTTYGGGLRGIQPDLVTLGKIVGGGMPIGAVGGRRDVMEHLAPLGPVYQAGTLSGNPVAVAAGMKTLELLESENPYPQLERLGKRLADGLNRIAETSGTLLHCAQLGGLFTPFFRHEPVRNLADAKTCDADAFARWFRKMLAAGIYLPPSPFEVAFLSSAHLEADVDAFLDSARNALG